MKPQRNGACRCGSGRKFKHCCGRIGVAGNSQSQPVVGASSIEINQLIGFINSGRFAHAEIAARSLTDRDPASGFAWKMLGIAQAQQNKNPLDAMGAAVALLPQDAEVRYQLGCVLYGLGRLDEAAASHWQAVQINPKYAVAFSALGRVLTDQGRFSDAAESYRRALMANPSDAETHLALARLLRSYNRLDDAEGLCRRAVQLVPQFAPAQAFLGDLVADRGQFLAAEGFYRNALDIQPNLAEAWIGLGRYRSAAANGADWLINAQRVAKSPLPLERAVDLRLMIGKYFDETGEYDEAFASISEANELTKSYGLKFDRERATLQVDRIMQVYNGSWMAANSTGGDDSNRPIFIVGMPRSGVGLTEHILAAHPQVSGAGENAFWLAAAASYEEAAGKSTPLPDLKAKISSEYLELLQRNSKDALRVTNSLPSNYLVLGLIHAALPKARIIHVQRNSLDTCWSIYRHNFMSTFSYAADLGDIAHQYAQYLRLMEYWRAMLPAGVMLELSYESLVHNPESSSRQILEFSELPWDSRCLNFQETDRPVLTASNWQYRQKMNTTSVNRWQPYDKFLEPLKHLQDIATP